MTYQQNCEGGREHPLQRDGNPGYGVSIVFDESFLRPVSLVGILVWVRIVDISHRSDDDTPNGPEHLQHLSGWSS